MKHETSATSPNLAPTSPGAKYGEPSSNLAPLLPPRRGEAGDGAKFPASKGEVENANLAPGEEENLGFCPHPHPFGATYRLQHIVHDHDVGKGKRAYPRAALCPWCDWKRLRRNEPRPNRSAILEITLKNSLR